MIGEIVSLTVLAGTAFGLYRTFVASKLDAHVESHGGAAKLVVTNNRGSTAYLRQIEARRPGTMLSKFDAIPLMIIGREPWEPPDYREPDRVKQLVVDLEVPPKATVTYSFRFFSDIRQSNWRIALVAWESSLIAKTKIIDCTISPKAVTIVQDSDTV